jgi:hypothetical protein
MTRPRLAVAFGIGLAVCLTRPQPVVALDVTQLLARASAYLVAYERSFSLVVSEEHYDQHGVDPLWSTRRTMRSDVLAPNVGEDDWVGFATSLKWTASPVRDPCRRRRSRRGPGTRRRGNAGRYRRCSARPNSISGDNSFYRAVRRSSRSSLKDQHTRRRLTVAGDSCGSRL